jgi:cyanophycin synthetase
LIAAHRARGGRAVYVHHDALYQAEGSWEARVTQLSSIPLTHGGRIGFQVDNVLAATAAAWSVGVALEAIRAGLTSFINSTRQTPARFNVLNCCGATVVVDYGHNADALSALIDAIGRIPHDRRLVVYTAAGDRRDCDIIRQAEIIGNGFDEVIIYEDKCTRGRPDGVVISLMRQGLARASRVSAIFETRGEFRAIEAGLDRTRTGDLILLQADQVDPALAFIEQQVARRSQATTSAAVDGQFVAPRVEEPKGNGADFPAVAPAVTVASTQR